MQQFILYFVLINFAFLAIFYNCKNTRKTAGSFVAKTKLFFFFARLSRVFFFFFVFFVCEKWQFTVQYNRSALSVQCMGNRA